MQNFQEFISHFITHQTFDFFPFSYKNGVKPNQTFQTLKLFSPEKDLLNYAFQEYIDCSNINQSNFQIDPTVWPYSTIGIVISEYNEQPIFNLCCNNNTIKSFGLGTLIGSNHVLCNAQIIYNHKFKLQAKKIVFVPIVTGKSEYCKVKKWYYPHEFIKSKQYQEFDIAILELEQDLKFNYGYLGMQLTSFNTCQFMMISYKTNQINLKDKKCIIQLQEIRGQCNSKNYITKKINDMRRCQGSPLLINKNHNIRVIGINSCTQNGNMPIFFTKELCQIININLKKSVQILSLKNILLNSQSTRDLKNYKCLNLIELYLYNNEINAEAIKNICESDWPQLQVLHIHSNKIGDQGMKLLINGKWPNLKHLHLFSNEITPKGMINIENNQWYDLLSFEFQYNKINTEGIQHLIKVKWPMLMDIKLINNNLGSEGIEKLKNANWYYLRNLHIQTNGIGDEGVKFLVEGNWPLLTLLNLESNKITEKGMNYLRCSKWPLLTTIDLKWNKINKLENIKFINWSNLNQIQLSKNNLGPEGIKQLSETKWKKLLFLNLNENCIGVDGLKYLKHGPWNQLTQFHLNNNNIGDYGIIHLIQGKWLKLKKLTLQQNQIGPEGAKYLSAAQWPLLQDLNLAYNNLTDKGIQYICQAKWQNLNYIHLNSNKLSAIGILIIKAKWLKLIGLYLQSNKLNDESMQYLCMGNWSQLKQLNLSKNELEIAENLRQELQRTFYSAEIYF